MVFASLSQPNLFQGKGRIVGLMLIGWWVGMKEFGMSSLLACLALVFFCLKSQPVPVSKCAGAAEGHFVGGLCVRFKAESSTLKFGMKFTPKS
jgi:hypothetical protein